MINEQELIRAIEQNGVKAIQEMENKCMLNNKDLEYGSVFFIALALKDVETIEYIVSKSAETVHFPVLYKILVEKDKQAFTVLLEAGISPNIEFSKTSILYSFVSRGDFEAVQMLLEAGADPNFAGCRGGVDTINGSCS